MSGRVSSLHVSLRSTTFSAGLTSQRTQTIYELEKVLFQLKAIAAEEESLLQRAPDRVTQSAAVSGLMRIETEEAQIMDQLKFLKKQR